MSNFEEWAASGGLDVKKFPMSNIYKDADTRVASVAWQEQQKKIDELQARVDKALHAADESCGVSVAAFVKLNNILKAVEQ